MTKIQANEYFKDSPLFTAEVIEGKPTASHSSSSVYYQLTCKLCAAAVKRRGNSKALEKCNGCQRVWNRENNSVSDPVVGGATTRRKAVAVVPAQVSSDDEDDDVPVAALPKTKAAAEVAPVVAPVVAPARNANYYLNIIANSGKKEAPKDEAEGYVTDILDHYDDYVEGKWHRFYYSLWSGYKEAHFARDDAFAVPKFINDYEAGLAEAERFKIKYPNAKSRYKNKIPRTKEDVYRDAGVAETPVEQPTAADEGEYVTIRISRVIKLRKGAPIEVPEGFTYELI